MDNLAVVLLESLVFFFCWVAEGFLSSCSSGSGAAGSRWSASELPLLVLGLSSSDLCLSLDILEKLSLGKLLRREGTRRERLDLKAGVQGTAGMEGFSKLKLENPLTFFPHPLDNLSIVYFLRRHETDLPGNLGNGH